MKKDNLKSIIVLSSICLVVAILLAAVNFITSPVIKENDDKKIQDSLRAVLPESDGFDLLDLPENAPKTVTSVYKSTNGEGYAVTVKTKSSYSKGDMAFTVGVSADGKIVDIVVTNYQETKDFGKDTYPKTYIGTDADSSVDIDVKSGVTYSSNAFKTGLADAFAVLSEVMGGEQ